MKKACVMLAAVSVVVLVSCGFEPNGIRGSGNLVSTTWDKGSFTKVRIGHTVNARIETGSSHSVTVTADDNIIEKCVGVFLDGDTVTVSMDPGYSYEGTVKVFAVITLPVFDTVEALENAAATVALPKSGSVGSFTAVASDNASLNLSLNADSMTMKSSGNSGITLSGTVTNLVITAKDNSRVTEEGTLETVKVEAGGNSSVDLRAPVIRNLDLKLTANSDLSVRKVETAVGSMNANSELFIYVDCPIRNISREDNADFIWR